MTPAIRSFRDLDAWQVAMDLVVSAYDIAARLPASERFGLGSQIRRAAVSIPANIAEGQGSGKDGRYKAHIRIAQGSLCELATHLESVGRLQLLASGDLAAVEGLVARTGQLLHGLARSIGRVPPVRSPF